MATAGSPYRETVPHGTVREEERRAEMAMGGSLVAGACGIGTIILAILGLANLAPVTLLGISTLVVGAALLAEGAAIAAKHAVHLEGGWFHGQAFSMLGSGLTAEFAGGIAGIVMGILCCSISALRS